jgi:hypothetical protein
MEAARLEAYEYFNQKIRPLPKLKNGKINVDANGLDDNDIDAFRHAYVSGVFTQEYGETVAKILGLMNEFDLSGTFSNSISPRSRNMDLWNNRVGRRYGKKTKGRKTLLKLIHQALKNGELIIDLNDAREFTGINNPPKSLSRPIIAVSETETGRNETYYDILKRRYMSREELLASIRDGSYPGYSIKVIRGIDTPVSKRDRKRINNIG